VNAPGSIFRDAAERFRREARAAARIKSEHVVRVLDVGMMNDSTPYMVMEYLDGRDLDDEVEERGVLPISDAVDYTLQAIEAIAEAHAAGIVHRDLKPGNLFLFQRRDGTRMIKVLDFGISKSLPSAESANQLVLTATASLIGSPLYMSPEQMQSPRGVDQRTDIWSLGAILYYSLTGRPPYPAENIAQLCSLLMNTVPTPISQLRPEVPADLERIIGRCLERDRERRFADVSELASALSEFASVLSSRVSRRVCSPGGAPQTTLLWRGTSPSCRSPCRDRLRRPNPSRPSRSFPLPRPPRLRPSR
jgi:serine/threonine-protein kinase